MVQTTTRRPPIRPPSPRKTAGAGRPTAGPRTSPTGAGAANPLVPGLIAAGWAAGAGLLVVALPVLLAWATDSRSGAGAAQALRTAAQLWLVANGGSVGAFGLVPLGLVALPLLLLARAGGHGARTGPPVDLRAGVVLLLAVSIPYAVTASVVAGLAASPASTPSPVRVLGTSLLVSLVGAGTGIARQSQLDRSATALVSLRLRVLGRCTVAGVAVVIGAGALLAAGSLAVHGGRASTLARSSDPGLVGGVALLLLGLAVLPNLALWGAAWLLGPGFAVGIGTAVGPFGTTLGAVPALPVLAGLPAAAPSPWVGVVALGVPLLAGALAGRLLARRTTGGPTRVAMEAALLAPTCGMLLATLAWLSGGPLGHGRLAAVGPSPWRVGLAAA